MNLRNLENSNAPTCSLHREIFLFTIANTGKIQKTKYLKFCNISFSFFSIWGPLSPYCEEDCLSGGGGERFGSGI